jgi:hypothetical protein
MVLTSRVKISGDSEEVDGSALHWSPRSPLVDTARGNAESSNPLGDAVKKSSRPGPDPKHPLTRLISAPLDVAANSGETPI